MTQFPKASKDTFMGAKLIRTKLKSVIWQIVLLVFAAPASFSVLSKFDSKWKFGEYLNIVILNFTAFSEEIWSAVAKSLPVLGHLDHLFLSFFLLTVVGSFASWIIGLLKADAERDDSTFWGSLSVASLLIIAIIFGVTWELLSFATFTFATPLSVVIAAVLLVGYRKHIISTISNGNLKKRSTLLAKAIALVSAIYLEAKLSVWNLRDVIGPEASFGTILIYYALTLLILLSVFLVWKLNLKGPTMVLIFSVGVLFTDFLDTSVRPKIEKFLLTIAETED